MSRLKHLQVLIVDDNSHMRAITASVLRSVGIVNIHEAQNGAVALERLRQHAIDLVFLDLRMDELDGLEFTRLVRNDPTSANPYLPIIMMTGHSEATRVIQARDAGVTEFLAKPITARAVLDRLNAVIVKSRPFIKTEGFFGPDRRRLNKGDYAGAPKRALDQSDDEEASAA